MSLSSLSSLLSSSLGPGTLFSFIRITFFMSEQNAADALFQRNDLFNFYSALAAHAIILFFMHDCDNWSSCPRPRGLKVCAMTLNTGFDSQL